MDDTKDTSIQKPPCAMRCSCDLSIFAQDKPKDEWLPGQRPLTARRTSPDKVTNNYVDMDDQSLRTSPTRWPTWTASDGKEDFPDKVTDYDMDGVFGSPDKVLNNDMDGIDGKEDFPDKVTDYDMDGVFGSPDEVLNNDMDGIDGKEDFPDKVTDYDMDGVFGSPDKVLNNDMDRIDGKDGSLEEVVNKEWTGDTIDLSDSPVGEYFEDSQVDTPFEHTLGGHDDQAGDDGLDPETRLATLESLKSIKKNDGDDGDSLSKETALDLDSRDPCDGEVAFLSQGSRADSVEPDSVAPSSPGPEVPNVPKEEGELTEKEIRTIQMHRESSRKWHEKWVSKGVPRNPKAPTVPKAKSKDKAVPKASAKSKAKPAPSTAAAAAPSAETFDTLQAARDWFVSDWISRSDMPQSKTRRAAALQAWMDSPLRSEVMALRLGIQKWFTLIPGLCFCFQKTVGNNFLFLVCLKCPGFAEPVCLQLSAFHVGACLGDMQISYGQKLEGFFVCVCGMINAVWRDRSCGREGKKKKARSVPKSNRMFKHFHHLTTKSPNHPGIKFITKPSNLQITKPSWNQFFPNDCFDILPISKAWSWDVCSQIFKNVWFLRWPHMRPEPCGSSWNSPKEISIGGCVYIYIYTNLCTYLSIYLYM